MDMEQRLERIEGKLDRLTDAIVAIARTEEQVNTLFAEHKKLETKLDTHDKDIQTLRERSHLMTNTTVELSAKVNMCMDTKDVVDDLRVDVHDTTKAIERIEKSNDAAFKRIERVAWIAVVGVVSIAGYLLERLFDGVFR